MNIVRNMGKGHDSGPKEIGPGPMIVSYDVESGPEVVSYT